MDLGIKTSNCSCETEDCDFRIGKRAHTPESNRAPSQTTGQLLKTHPWAPKRSKPKGFHTWSRLIPGLECKSKSCKTLTGHAPSKHLNRWYDPPYIWVCLKLRTRNLFPESFSCPLNQPKQGGGGNNKRGCVSFHSHAVKLRGSQPNP